MNKRKFIKCASGLFLSPATVKAENIMRIKSSQSIIFKDEFSLFDDPLNLCVLIDKGYMGYRHKNIKKFCKKRILKIRPDQNHIAHLWVNACLREIKSNEHG